MILRFWGVRGSVPTPGQSTVIYGGNTACVSLEVGDKVLIFDAGTGIRVCGQYLLSKSQPLEAALFISHTHWDHIQGFPFFVPAYVPGNALTMFGPPSEIKNLSLKQLMELQTSFEYFPVRISELGAKIEYFDCKEGRIETPGLEVHTCRLNHPVACLAYKVVAQGKVFVYGGDHEPFRNLYRGSKDEAALDEELLAELDLNAAEQNKRIADFCQDADLVIWDAQYSAKEYVSKKGWGHSSYEADVELAQQAAVKHIIFTHHDPASADEKLAAAEKKYRAVAAEKGFRLDFAKEGLRIDL